MKLLPLVLLFCLAAVPSWAAVAFDAKTATVVSATATSISTTYVMGSVSNGALVVPIMWGGSAQPASITATYNGVAMTQITGTNTGTNGGCTCSGAIYGLLAPASGSHTLTISWTGSTEAHITAVSFSGVDQTSIAVAFPHGTFFVANTATASPIPSTATPVTSATGNMVVGAGSEQVSAWGAISGTTIASDSSTGPQLTYASNYTTGAATVSPTFAFTGTSVQMYLATDVLASGGGGGALCGRASALHAGC